MLEELKVKITLFFSCNYNEMGNLFFFKKQLFYSSYFEKAPSCPQKIAFGGQVIITLIL